MSRDLASELQEKGSREQAEVTRDRQVTEVLQELRVAITGGQILFGFLLTVPFAQGWADTDHFQRTLFLITLLAIASATAFFIAPTAAHRIRFHRRDRGFVVAYANFAALAGLCCLLIAMVSAVLLVTDFVFSRTTAVVASVAIATVLISTWFATPLARFARDD